MKILQTPISNDHKSAMFFDGVIAEDGGFKLETYQDGEITYDDVLFIGKEIIELAKDGSVGDPDVEDDGSPCVQILVDKFFVICNGDTLLDEGELYFDNYDEAIEGFQNFLNKL